MSRRREMKKSNRDRANIGIAVSQVVEYDYSCRNFAFLKSFSIL